MKNQFWLLNRNGIFYIQDAQSRRKQTLHTRNRREAQRLRITHNRAAQASFLDLAFAKAYLSARDPDFPKRTWQNVMDCFCTRGKPETQVHRKRITGHRHFNCIRSKKILETTNEDFLKILRAGGVMVHTYLHCLQSLALGLNWLPWPILPNKLWPVLHSKPKRAITAAEHQRIVSTETNVERRLYYELLWEIGASQTDAASLSAENVEWKNRLLSYQRRKTGVWSYIRIGSRLEGILRRLPEQGMLFPALGKSTVGARAAEFRRRCRILKIEGISLHSYRYAWAKRAKTVGYPERFAQEALGHKSKAVHRAYAKKAHVILPSLEEYERANQPLLPLFAAQTNVPTIQPA
jgi:integrase